MDEMYTQVAEKWLAQKAELTSVQKQFLEKALAFYQQLATEESADPTVLFETAQAEQRVGELQNKLGKYVEAETAYRRAIELFGQLAHTEQDAQYNQALAKTHRSLGLQLYSTGQLPEAEQQQRLAVSLCQALATQFPGELPVSIGPRQESQRIGLVLAGMGERDQAREAFRQSISLLESLLTRSPADRDLKHQLASSWTNLAEKVEARERRVAEAEAIYRGVASRAAELVADDPRTPNIVSSWVMCPADKAGTCGFFGRSAESETVLRQAVTIQEGLVRDFPQVPEHQNRLTSTLSGLAVVPRDLAEFEESRRVQRQSLAILEKLAAEYPQVPNYRSRIGGDFEQLGRGSDGVGELGRGSPMRRAGHRTPASRRGNEPSARLLPSKYGCPPDAHD